MSLFALAYSLNARHCGLRLKQACSTCLRTHRAATQMDRFARCGLKVSLTNRRSVESSTMRFSLTVHYGCPPSTFFSHNSEANSRPATPPAFRNRDAGIPICGPRRSTTTMSSGSKAIDQREIEWQLSPEHFLTLHLSTHQQRLWRRDANLPALVRRESRRLGKVSSGCRMKRY